MNKENNWLEEICKQNENYGRMEYIINKVKHCLKVGEEVSDLYKLEESEFKLVIDKLVEYYDEVNTDIYDDEYLFNICLHFVNGVITMIKENKNDNK